jgi:hypothetical protein
VPAGSAVDFSQNVAGPGSAIAARWADGINAPYWLQAALIQARRLVSLLFPSIGQPGATAGSFASAGNGHTASSAVWNSATGSVVGGGTPSVWPFRPSLSILGAAAANIGRAAVGGLSLFISVGAGGGFLMRTICGCGGVVANVTGVLVGLVQNSLAVGANMATQFGTNGVYFVRAPGINAGNWTVSSDNGAARSGNIDTTMPFTTVHVYELILYMTPGANGNVLFWQVNDLTAGTTASGNFLMASTQGRAVNRRWEIDVLDTATAAVDWMGTDIEYDAVVA